MRLPSQADAVLTAARTVARAPWLLIFAAVPPFAAKFLPEPSVGSGIAAALSRVWPVLVASAALTAFAALLRVKRGRRFKRPADDATITFCYVLVALLIGSSGRGFATARFEALLLAHVRADFTLWARLSGLFTFALQLAGFAWIILLSFGLPSAPKRPELFGALADGLRGLARRLGSSAIWIAIAAACDWFLARGGGSLATAASASRFAAPTLLVVAWLRQSVEYIFLVAAPLAAAESP